MSLRLLFPTMNPLRALASLPTRLPCQQQSLNPLRPLASSPSAAIRVAAGASPAQAAGQPSEPGRY